MDNNKTRYDVQKILREAIIQGLATIGGGGVNWNVIEFANPALINIDHAILLRYSRTENCGWQYTLPNETTAQHQIQKQVWEVHFLEKQSASGTSDGSFTGEDAASNLMMWFNGPGCDYLRQYNMSNERIDTNSSFVYNDDSNLYQKRVVFMLKVFVPKIIGSQN